jgi:protein-S-isoprenylcysteine O-methyltransferase Ste14
VLQSETNRPTRETPCRWWQNCQGELFVLGQFVLFGLIAFAPPTLPGLPAWNGWLRLAGRVAGSILFLAGLGLGLSGVLALGRHLTPLITPKEGSTLREDGPYRIVRHPIYSGLVQMAMGWGLWQGGWVTLFFALLLLLLFDRKARREERFLLQAFPDYEAYARRVRRLIPFIY